MIINRYILDNKISDTAKSIVRLNMIRGYKNQLLGIIGDEKKRVINRDSIFSSVEIETVNRCNGSCPFCPVNKKDDIREYAKMPTDLFIKIVGELGDMNYSGRLALHSNNEPFLDERIVDFAAYARVKVPNAFIYMYTNGTLLNPGLLKSILPYLDRIYIDNYSDELKLHKNIEEIHELCKKDPEMDKKVMILLRKVNEVLTTRGGLSPNNDKKVTLQDIPCILPFRQMVIRPDGKISLCCNDPYGKYTLGDVSTSSLKDVWYSDYYNEIRHKIIQGRQNLDCCRYCDNMPRISAY